MRRLLQLKLKILARLVLQKYQPQIIGITGSIGKTSAKDAIAWVLSYKFSVRASYKNYNNEIGLPLTILGLESGGRSISAWLAVLARALKLLIFTDKNYPKFLILEMGVDRPGDMDYLTKIVKPNIGVVTAVSHSHLEFFGSLSKIQAEKQKLVEQVDNNGLVVLNYDNEATRAMAEASRAKVLSYGFDRGADLVAQEWHGRNFKLSYQGSIVPVFMKQAVGRPAVYAVLAGAALGLHYGLNLLDIAQRLSEFKPPLGRLNLIPALKGATIIDDTYNSSPDSALAALEVLGEMPARRRWAVLGDMLEIGSYSESGHRQVGEKVSELKIDFLISVGPQSRFSAQAALENGLDENHVHTFDSPSEAADFLLGEIENEDLILIKGSQGMRMEKAVKAIMAQPDQAKDLLVRQGAEWD
ncbi:MAG: UDP-N-acetylmuramoyl-tripeptide--D-alanyl-D-alanine ligase [Patescibacteria group bacterium]